MSPLMCLLHCRSTTKYYVDGLKGRFANRDWTKKFDKVWVMLKQGLEASDLIDERNANMGAADVLTTKVDTRDTRIAELETKIDKLTDALDKLMTEHPTSVLRTSVVWPECGECGAKHPKGKRVPCIGKALAEGQITEKEAIAALGPRNANPQRAIQNAKDRYEAHQKAQREIGQTQKSSTVTFPRKSVVLMTSTTTVNHNATNVIEVDTKADITILSDPAYFLNGVDSSRAIELNTIDGVTRTRPCTLGCGDAYVQMTDGTLLILQDAHLYPEARANVLATKPIHERAIPDLTKQCLRMTCDGHELPFDAGYCSMFINPVQSPFFCAYEPRHPEVAAAILYSGVHF